MSKLNEMIDHVMLAEPNDYRPYLGMSQIGNPDERMLWLNFRWWLEPNQFEPRVSRIMDLGTVLEDIIVGYLEKAKELEVFTKDKKRQSIHSFSAWRSLLWPYRWGYKECTGQFKTNDPRNKNRK